MIVTIAVDGVLLGELEVVNVWRDLLVYAAHQWDIEATLVLAAALTQALAS